MGTAVALAEGNGHFRDRGLAVGIEEFRAVGDDGAVLLLRAAEEAGDVHEGHQRDVEGVAEADETRGLAAGVDVEHAGEHLGLVRHDADAAAVHVGEADDDVLGELGMDLEEVTVVDDALDDLVHVVGLVRVVGDDLVQAVLHAGNRVGGGLERGLFAVVLRDEAQQALDGRQRFLLIVGREMGHAALGGMDGCAAELLLVHDLAGHALDDGRAGQEHVGGIFHHEGKVGQGRAVDGTAGAGTHNEADLRDDAAREDVALEDLAEAGQGVDAFLDAGAAGVVQADAGRAVADCEVHDLADLLGHGLGQRTAADGEILGKDIDQAAVNRAAAGHDAVAVRMALVHAEVRAAVLDEHVVFFETAFVEKEGQTLARREFTLFVLRFYALFAAAETGFGPALNEFGDVLSLYAHKQKSVILL